MKESIVDELLEALKVALIFIIGVAVGIITMGYLK